MEYEERVVDSKLRYKGQIIDVFQETVKLPNGELANRDVVQHSDAIAILAFTDTGKALFEKQWREPINKVTIEIPAGKVDEGEDFLETAKRELNEETGLIADKLEKITGFYSTPGFADEYMVLYKASGLKPVENKLPKDKGENLSLIEYSLEEALTAVKNGEIEDAKTIMAIFYWQIESLSGAK